jgi:hypothetical protein
MSVGMSAKTMFRKLFPEAKMDWYICTMLIK